jgi:hypothetical protein
VTVADSDGRTYLGKTIIRLKGTTMDVTNYTAEKTSTTAYNVSWPNNGVLYVKNRGACKGEIPTEADYDEPVACGNVYVSGIYGKPLTIAAANDVIVRPTDGATLTGKSSDSDIKLVDGTDAVLGLIANNFVRIYHPFSSDTTSVQTGHNVCNNGSNGTGSLSNLQIDAAILAINHSFIVDHYDCGAGLGTLTVNGAIAQKYRGAVGTSTGTGYKKSYNYDNRLTFLEPPSFIEPVQAEWVIGRETVE